jgi:hypothetical protein
VSSLHLFGLEFFHCQFTPLQHVDCENAQDGQVQFEHPRCFSSPKMASFFCRCYFFLESKTRVLLRHFHCHVAVVATVLVVKTAERLWPPFQE